MNHKMFVTRQELILASASPRRREFLHNLGIDFTVLTADIDETPLAGEQPETFALRMAREKAESIAAFHPQSWVIGADTVVTLMDGIILGKPADEEEALVMLNRLNNTSHQVMTGLCLICSGINIEQCLVETTEVTFADIPVEVLRAYVATGEPFDKAGAYGIQGLGSCLVSSIKGSCTNVIGLPVNRLIALLLSNEIIAANSLTPRNQT